MKALKLTIGILCCVFCVMVLFQSCAAGVSNTLSGNEENSGFAGFFVSLCMLTGGIITLATRNSTNQGGAIAATIVFIIGALMGYCNAGTFADLKVWSTVCLINGAVNLISVRNIKKAKTEELQSE